MCTHTDNTRELCPEKGILGNAAARKTQSIHPTMKIRHRKSSLSAQRSYDKIVREAYVGVANTN